MDNEGGLMVSAIVYVVVTYLLNTGLGLQAMKIGEEWLIFPTSNARVKEYHWFSLVYQVTNRLMFNAAYKVSNYTSAERYAKELVIIHHASGDTLKEGELSLKLEQIYQNKMNLKRLQNTFKRQLI